MDGKEGKVQIPEINTPSNGRNTGDNEKPWQLRVMRARRNCQSYDTNAQTPLSY